MGTHHMDHLLHPFIREVNAPQHQNGLDEPAGEGAEQERQRKDDELVEEGPLGDGPRDRELREAGNPTAFSALTARSSPRMPAVFFPATFVMVATSSMMRARSSSRAKNPEGMGQTYFSGRTWPVR